MKVKRYEGKSEQEIMQRVKDELGLSAIILSIKRKPYRGLMAFFKAPLIVVTAAYEEKTSIEKINEAKLNTEKINDKLNAEKLNIERMNAEKLNADKLALQQRAQAFLQEQAQARMEEHPERPAEVGTEKVKDVQLADQQQRIVSLESKLSATEELLEKVVAQLNVAEQMTRGADTRKYEDNMIQLFYDSLVEQGVTHEIAEKLLENVDAVDEQDKVDMNLIVRIVYNTVLDYLGEPSMIEVDPDREDIEVVAFMGPTGVGKTTTIAKLSSMLALEHHVRVGLISADTYRIAAVEQLKTYAEILGLDVQVVYNTEDIENNLDLLRPINDVILIDTAGRSHRSEENLTELKQLLDRLPEGKRYLVLSITTKYEDLLSIVKTYAAITDFDIIFTKLDETETLGSILNICYLTGKKASYVTFGQNVPDDIEIIQPDKITKALLGLSASAGSGDAYGQGGN